MSVNDPISDMLTRIRNGVLARHDFIPVPASKMKIAIANVLKEEGFIKDYEVMRGTTPQRVIKIRPKYTERKLPVITGLQRVSKPGLRVYVGKDEIPRVYDGLGIAIISTPVGILTGRQAYQKGVGGEILCYVW